MRQLLLLLCLFIFVPVQANNSVLNDLITKKQDTFLPINDAFKLDFDQQGDVLFIGWDIAPGYYLYKHKLEVIAKGADITLPDLPIGTEIEDEFFGKTEVYFKAFSVVTKLDNITDNAVVKVRYQGCAEAGLCYPPDVITIPLSPLQKANSPSVKSINVDAVNQSDKPDQSFTEQLSQQSLLTNLAIFFAVGVGLAFTPCVFPMFPILSSLIAGQTQLSTKKAFVLSFVYIQGMALTYAALGLVVAALGGQVQGYIQHPVVLISFSLLFVLLALSMFGLFEIKLPERLMNKLTNISNQQQGGNILGVFSMGVLSGLIASPCTTAPLSAALLYVAQSGDYFVGGITLYVLSLGMGLPLLLLGTSGGKLLPKAGGWMEQVKTIFGFIMLVVPLILLERILSFNTILLLACALLFACALYLHYWQSLLGSGKFKTFLWGVSCVFIVSSVLVTKEVILTVEPVTQTQSNEQKFQLVDDLAAMKKAVKQANQEGKIAIVDLYAEWCVACKEFEKYTFSDPQVQREFKHFSLLKLDLTKTDDKSMEIMDTFTVFGLPTILFFDLQGNELTQHRVTGFLNAEEFTFHLKKIIAAVEKV